MASRRVEKVKVSLIKSKPKLGFDFEAFVGDAIDMASSEVFVEGRLGTSQLVVTSLLVVLSYFKILSFQRTERLLPSACLSYVMQRS